ncbi:MAG: hypothetical protein ACKPKO_49335, partial [Candidatus Fonsibacter sp.]
INDVRLQYVKLHYRESSISSSEYYREFKVIDSMIDLYNKNVFLSDIKCINKYKRKNEIEYQMRIDNVKPTLKLGKIYFCDIIFNKISRYVRPLYLWNIKDEYAISYYSGTILRAQESSTPPPIPPPIPKSNKHIDDIFID